MPVGWAVPAMRRDEPKPPGDFRYGAEMPSITEFTDAIIRRPARSVVGGLRAGAGPDPSYEGVSDEVARYAAALINEGVAVTMLPALEDFPDSVFVEDAALVFPEGAVVLRPGAPSRRGEAAAMAPTLRDKFETVLTLDEGHVDGGDVLTTQETVFIGLSERTDRKGAEALQRLLGEFGRRARIVETPPGVLHFKSDCAILDDETILATPRLAASGVFASYRVIETPDGEEAAANALRVNGALLVGSRYARTAELLAREQYRVMPLPVDHIARIDAGLSCLSLRWRNINAS